MNAINLSPVRAYLLCSEGARESDSVEQVLGPWSSERAAMLAGLTLRRRSLSSTDAFLARDFSVHAVKASRTKSGNLSIANVLEAVDFLDARQSEESPVLLSGIPAKIFLKHTLPALEENYQAA